MVLGIMDVGCGGVGGQDVILMGWWGRAHWEDHISVKTRRMWGALWGRTLEEVRKVTVRKSLETGTCPMRLGNSKAASTAGAERQGLPQSLAGHCEGWLWLPWVQWLKSLEGCDPEGNDLTLWNRLALTATLRDWQEAENGSKTGNGVFCPISQNTSIQIKKKIPLTQQFFGITNYEQSIMKLFQ